MKLIMSNPTERELIRMRQDAEIDWRTAMNSEREEGGFDMLAGLVKKGLLSPENAAREANMTVHDFVARIGLNA